MFLTLLIIIIFLGLFIALFLGIGTLLFKILYTFCIGLPIAICLSAVGVVFCITIIGIPVGVLLFKAAGVVLVPFR